MTAVNESYEPLVSRAKSLFSRRLLRTVAVMSKTVPITVAQITFVSTLALSFHVLRSSIDIKLAWPCFSCIFRAILAFC